MDYSELSDFEINKLVARLNDGICLNDQVTAIDCYLTANNSNCVKWYRIDCCDPSEFDLFNPCNNPSDAWPIIVENKISIFPTGLDEYNWQAEQAIIGIFKDKNPLRAAMIVYLMMNEDK